MAAIGKRFKAEQIVNLLREIDVMMANGKSLLEACKKVGVIDKRCETNYSTEKSSMASEKRRPS